MGYVHLSYYPLGKNIFFIAKDLFENYQRGETSDIHPTEFRSKDNKVALEWTWTKGLEINDNKNAWLYYFNSFGEKIEQPAGLVNYIDSLKWVFSPADRIISKYAGSIKELESNNTLAVHVRRGDTCSTDLSTSFREVFSTDEYCKKISEMINLHNFDSLYIASDSADEIEKISKEFPNLRIINPIPDRGFFYRASSQYLDMEDYYTENYSNNEIIAESAILDLLCMQRCSGFIGTAASRNESWFSRLAYFLQVAHHGRETPFMDLSGNSFDPYSNSHWENC